MRFQALKGNNPRQPEDTLESVVAEYRATWDRVDEVVSAANFDDQCQALSGSDAVNLRWIVVHMLEETARHAGHADIRRELIDGQTGADAKIRLAPL